MFFQSYFPEAEILIVPADIGNGGTNVTKDNWYTSSYGIKRVMGELARCGNQFAGDIKEYLNVKSKN